MGLFKNLWDDIKSDFDGKPKTTTSTVTCVSGTCTTVAATGATNGISITGATGGQTVHVNVKDGTSIQTSGFTINNTGHGNKINLGTGPTSKTAINVKKIAVPVSAVPVSTVPAITVAPTITMPTMILLI